MAITPDKVEIGASGEFLDGVSVDTAAGTGLFRETVVTADPENGAALARVLSAKPADTDFGLVVRPAGESDVADSGEREYTHKTAFLSSGSTTVHTPTPGKAIRLRKIMITSNPTAGFPVISVVLGGQEIYLTYNGFTSRQRKTGTVSGALTVSLDSVGAVAVTAILEEV